MTPTAYLRGSVCFMDSEPLAWRRHNSEYALDALLDDRDYDEALEETPPQVSRRFLWTHSATNDNAASRLCYR